MQNDRTAATSGGVIRSAEAILKTMEDDEKFASLLVDDPRFRKRIPDRWAHNTIRTAEVARLWRREGRKALAIHPGLVDAVRMATSDKVPPEVFRALPYINPMVLLPEPIPIKTWRSSREENRLTPYKEGSMRMVGFLVYTCYDGKIADECSYEQLVEGIQNHVSLTTDPLAPRLAVSIVSEILDTSGRVVDTESSNMTFSLTGEPKTLKTMVAEQAARFEFFDKTTAPVPWITEIYKVVLGILMYLASTTLEAETVPASACRKVRSSMLRKPISLYRVGWTTGAALDRFRKEKVASRDESQQQGLAHQQDPQHRRAHFKTVWTGPGRSIPKTAFVSAYWTHRERLGTQGVNTLHRVRDKRGRTA